MQRGARRPKPPAGLTVEDLSRLYYFMRLNRGLDDRITSLYRRGQIPGAAYGSRGQEATSVGAAYAMGPDDVIGPMIRNAGATLVRGFTPRELLASFLGRLTSPSRGRDGNSHFGDLGRGLVAPISMLGALIPTLAGCALAFKYRGERRVALTWIGDGGSSTGDFHEGLNIAATMALPFVLIIENNGYAYSTPVSVQSVLIDLAEKARAYGIPGVTVDGNDVLAVHRIVKEAVERARSGGGPTVVEAKTFRIRGHAEHDDASYVPREVLEAWKRKDPIDRFRNYLVEHGFHGPESLDAIDTRIEAELAEAEAVALSDPMPPVAQAESGVYAGDDPWAPGGAPRGASPSRPPGTEGVSRPGSPGGGPA